MVLEAPCRALRDVRVTPMRRRHLRGVLAIEHLVYPRPWPPSLFASELARRDSRRYVVALASPPQRRLLPGRKVVGYAGVLVQVAQAHVTTVAVHPHHHRQKIATRLLLEILTEARARGAQAATLEVRATNRGAQRLYSGFGFVPVGVRPGYYAETGEDALIMWAHELQGPDVTARLAAQSARLGLPGGSSGAPDLPVPWVKHRIGLETPAATEPGGAV